MADSSVVQSSLAAYYRMIQRRIGAQIGGTGYVRQRPLEFRGQW